MKNLLRGVGLVILLLVCGCSSERSTQPFQWPVPLSIKGEWEGLMTHTTVFGMDSVNTIHATYRFSFEDSTWGYEHLLPPGGPPLFFGCYSPLNRYVRTDDSLFLTDACIYSGIVDWRMIPRSEYHIRLTEVDLTMTYTFFNDYIGVDIQQRFDFRRVSD